MKYLNHNLLSRLGNLPLEARHSMTGNVSGRHRSASRGSSVEFAEYRKYVAGDDTRRLDWKAYARSDRYYIKEFEADTNLRAYIVMDLSGSMNYHPEQVETKYMRACRLAANLAYIAIRQGDAVGPEFCPADEGRRRAAHPRLPPPRPPERAHQPDGHAFSAGGDRPSRYPA